MKEFFIFTQAGGKFPAKNFDFSPATVIFILREKVIDFRIFVEQFIIELMGIIRYPTGLKAIPAIVLKFYYRIVGKLIRGQIELFLFANMFAQCLYIEN